MSKNKKKGARLPIHEVLNKGGVIAWFDDFGGDHEHAVLSNFYKGAPIVLPLTWEMLWEGEAARAWMESHEIDPGAYVEAATGEHLFAAFKAEWVDDFAAVLLATNKQGVLDPGKSKELGRKIGLREDWEEIKLDVMMLVLRSKFTLARHEGQVLLGTGDALLIEGTHWADRVWGVDLDEDHPDPQTAYGRNWLGTLLMARRAELAAEMMYGATSRAMISNLAQVF